jgi:hypothetical protein
MEQFRFRLVVLANPNELGAEQMVYRYDVITGSTIDFTTIPRSAIYNQRYHGVARSATFRPLGKFSPYPLLIAYPLGRRPRRSPNFFA